jgi:tight adherence protein B
MIRARLAAVALGLLAVGVLASPAGAAETGRIVELGVADGTLRLVFQTDGLAEGVTVDPASVTVQVGEESLAPTAEPVAADDTTTVTRTAVLALDNSRSMVGERFTAAKAAAYAFLDALPEDVAVGLVTFAETPSVEVEPTTDRDLVRATIDGLVISDASGTALFDGTATAFDQTGDDGVRSVIVLTDGNESGSSGLSLEEAVGHATDDGVTVDAVYISDNPEQPPELQQLIGGAGGTVRTSDPAGLAAAFEEAAGAITNQLLVTAPLPEGISSSRNVVVTAQAGTTEVSDSAFLPIKRPRPPAPQVDYGPRALATPTAPAMLTTSALPVVLGAIFMALLALLYVALASIGKDDKQGRVRRRLSLYTLTGRPTMSTPKETTALGATQVARSAVELASKVAQKRDFEASLGLRLEAAGVPLRAAEWMLIHIGTAVGAALLGLLLSGGRVLPTALGLAMGLGLPFGYLIVKESRRTSAFLAQLPDTLQLISGSLSAGYSLPQAMDAVVREGTQPIMGEFNRALVEARLGVPIEDALDGIGERMRSKDFSWVVMAIRIQREVGGNLAELLTTVAGTLRERERLRRQVSVLSAEGRLSAWILGLLPLVFAAYLMVAQPSYLEPLVTEPLGYALVILGLTLLVIGALWMRKTVKVEV